MDRRSFTRSLLGAAGLVALGARADAPDAWQAAFESRRAQQPWQMGFEGLQDDAAPLPLAMRGRVPPALYGAFYRNGPARHTLGGERYHHWFDGDGMLQQYRMGPQGVVHQGRFVRTDKYLADTAAGYPVRPAFGTNPPHAEPIRSADAMNVANTSVVSHGGELLALWEGGSATRIDPQTLQTRGLKTWTPEYAGMPFSAHPRLERDGSLWNFGVSSTASLLSIYRVSADGRDVRTASLQVPDIAMVHDFAVTERHLVFLLPPLVFDVERLRAGQTFLASHVWRPALGLRVLVLPKAQLDAPRWFQLPAGFVFHIGNAWEDTRRGVIRLDYIRSPDAWWATQGIPNLMRGQYQSADHATMALVELDLQSGQARQELLPHAAEFPRVDPRFVGQRYRHVLVSERVAAGPRPGYDAVTRIDVQSGRADRYRYGTEVLAEEHIFVPRAGAPEGHGWVLGTALDLRQRAMLLSVFDAQHLVDGPIAQGVLPRVMPLGLHGIFVGA
ncbi:carotenoid oxygenase family protein [Pseudorhodoferax sp. Leaf267]|uniref:carotenoid oxygenase family protein n=1 Tax=Pseudorhodoferax sp. Leaf267 TaxID=1736316 RepID=UPI0006FDC484|nr:carotenoid oxygenase family protein [Pseudorhodoferax sp. Leaf267]KQP13217.1 carotenoid oxygenase [Pseudorhodoferax sp. Leaf267]